MMPRCAEGLDCVGRCSTEAHRPELGSAVRCDRVGARSGGAAVGNAAKASGQGGGRGGQRGRDKSEGRHRETNQKDCAKEGGGEFLLGEGAAGERPLVKVQYCTAR